MQYCFSALCSAPSVDTNAVTHMKKTHAYLEWATQPQCLQVCLPCNLQLPDATCKLFWSSFNLFAFGDEAPMDVAVPNLLTYIMLC